MGAPVELAQLLIFTTAGEWERKDVSCTSLLRPAELAAAGKAGRGRLDLGRVRPLAAREWKYHNDYCYWQNK